MVAANNIFNIRDTKQNFLGSNGSTKGFVVFNDYGWCVRAAMLILRNYNRRGIKTIEQIISTWAPPSENNTSKYISFVCDLMHVSKATEISLHKPLQLFQFFQAMARFETNTYLYFPDFDLGYLRFLTDSCDFYEKV